MKKIIDLSKFNPVADYNKVANHVDGVILRIGYRGLSNGKIVIDPLFLTHYNNLKGKTKLGIYFFTTAINTQEAEEEVQWIINTIKGMNFDPQFPIIVDTEFSNATHTGRSDKLNAKVRTDIILAWVNACTKAGYIPAVYSGNNLFTSILEVNRLKGINKWVARYGGKKPTINDSLIGFQHGSDYIPGINKPVDVNEWYIDLKSHKITNTPKKESAPVVEPIKETSKVIEKQKTIKSNSTLILSKAKLYSNAKSTLIRRYITGTYYPWNITTNNGRIRIVKSKNDINGPVSKVVGWINISEIKEIK